MGDRQVETGTDDLLGHVDGGVGVLTFNRPERRNALSEEMYDGFRHGLADLAADPAVRVAIDYVESTPIAIREIDVEHDSDDKEFLEFLAYMQREFQGIELLKWLELTESEAKTTAAYHYTHGGSYDDAYENRDAIILHSGSTENFAWTLANETFLADENIPKDYVKYFLADPFK